MIYRMKEITINPQQIAACIRYIRENGEDAFAEKMAKDQQMTMKRE